MSEDQHNFGTLEPIPDGDPIPLIKKRLRIGRREGCDIVLNFSNISGHHALMEVDEGFWFIKDLRSRHGIKVDGKKIIQGLKKRLDPNIVFAIANQEFVIRYDPKQLGAYGNPPPDEQLDNLFSRSLLDRAGLKPGGATKGIRPWDAPKKRRRWAVQPILPMMISNLPTMKIILTTLIGVAVLSGCTDQNGNPRDGLEEGETLIGTYQVKPSGSLVFEHSFSQPQWIGFNSNISWAEMERFDNVEEEFASVEIHHLGSDKFVGSHFGAATVFTPATNGANSFKITNRSKEALTITVYWKPK